MAAPLTLQSLASQIAHLTTALQLQKGLAPPALAPPALAPPVAPPAPLWTPPQQALFDNQNVEFQQAAAEQQINLRKAQQKQALQHTELAAQVEGYNAVKTARRAAAEPQGMVRRGLNVARRASGTSAVKVAAMESLCNNKEDLRSAAACRTLSETKGKRAMVITGYVGLLATVGLGIYWSMNPNSKMTAENDADVTGAKQCVRCLPTQSKVWKSALFYGFGIPILLGIFIWIGYYNQRTNLDKANAGTPDELKALQLQGGSRAALRHLQRLQRLR